MKNQSGALRVENVTRHTTLVDQGRLANRFWMRLRGLMGVQHLAPGAGLLIAPANQVHTHFMRIPLDLFYLNQQAEIIAIDPDLPPWRVGRRYLGAHAVLETPAGTAARTNSAVGDQLRLVGVDPQSF
jgi:uncharacterized protein